MSEIGRKVKRLRKERNLTQDQVAERSGVAQSTLALIESGKRIPSSTSVLKLAAGLNVEVGELYPKDRSPSLFDLEGEAGRPDVTTGERIYPGWPEDPSEEERVTELENVADLTEGLFSRWMRIRERGYGDTQDPPSVRAMEVRLAAIRSLEEAGNNARRIEPRSEAERQAKARLYTVLGTGLESLRLFEHDAQTLLTEASEVHDAGMRDIARLLREMEQGQRADV